MTGTSSVQASKVSCNGTQVNKLLISNEDRKLLKTERTVLHTVSKSKAVFDTINHAEFQHRL